MVKFHKCICTFCRKKGQISISVHFWAAEVEALLCRQLVLLQREFPPSVGALKPGVREVFRPGLEAFEAPGALVVASWCRLGAREGWHWLNGAWMGGGRGLKSTFFAYFRNFFAWNQISNRSRLKYFENCSKTEQLRHYPNFKAFFLELVWCVKIALHRDLMSIFTRL